MSLPSQVLSLWNKRKSKLLHDFAHVAYLLNPHPKVMAEAAQTKSLVHDQAVERLITKLYLSKILKGQERKEEVARLVDLFWNEYADFTGRSNLFNSEHTMWIIAAKDDNKPYEWHRKYARTCTKILGDLGCKVSAKILGQGLAERHWILMKEVKKVSVLTLELRRWTSRCTSMGCTAISEQHLGRR